MQSSNYTLVENNKGTGNDNGIIEINCYGNTFYGNSFSYSRGRDNSNGNKEDIVFIDFTLVLIFLLGGLIFLFPILRKIR